jgi:riboflavin biosynthesis pyrimidine reductase
MRALFPVPVDDVDAHVHYAAEWLDRGGVRVNMISSLDGAATSDGLSEGLQTPGDNQVFAALRDLADVVLVGAGTAAAEGYQPINLGEHRIAIRREYGLAAAVPTAIVSRSLHVDPASPLFREAPDGARTIVLTCAAADASTRAALAEVAEVVICGEGTVELDLAYAALRARGLGRVLCEGGPTLLASLAGAGMLDELCLTISPLLAGPGGIRIVEGRPWEAVRSHLKLIGLLEQDNALFLRMRADRL